MAYQSLYRTYRPKDFTEIVGQDHITQTLKNAIVKNQIAHAYLFTGPRGTGKTSIAKIFAKAINCINVDEVPCNHCEYCEAINLDNHPDIVEIDAASNNGVDEIRDLVEKVKYAPLELTYKVYIIDEVHMLTQGAFNALLKTLEEPPEHVIFILATTEVHKVLPTIISRCQRYDFDRISDLDIITRLEHVFETEKIDYDESALKLIADLADGAMRNALTISEQVISYAEGKIAVQDVQKVYKIVGPDEKLSFIEALLEGQLEEAIGHLQKFETESIEYKRFINDLVQMAKEAVVVSLTGNKELISEIQSDQTIKLANNYNRDDLLSVIDEFLKVSQDTLFNGLYQEYLQIAAIKLCHQFKREESKEKMVEEKMVEEIMVEEVKVEEVKVEEVKVKEEKVEEPVEKVKKNLDAIIEWMVLGNKELKVSELALWPKMKEYETDFKYRKVSTWLNRSTIGISDYDFVVLVVESPEEADFLNSNLNQELVKEVVEVVLETKKDVFVITKQEFDDSVDEFRVRYQNNTLPDETKVREKRKKQSSQQVVVKEEEPSPQEKVQEFFGDSLTIVE